MKRTYRVEHYNDIIREHYNAVNWDKKWINYFLDISWKAWIEFGKLKTVVFVIVYHKECKFCYKFISFLLYLTLSILCFTLFIDDTFSKKIVFLFFYFVLLNKKEAISYNKLQLINNSLVTLTIFLYTLKKQEKRIDWISYLDRRSIKFAVLYSKER